MGKEQKGGLVLTGATTVAFLLLLTWLYASFLDVNPLESWKDQLSYWRSGGFSSKNGDKGIEEVNVEPLKLLLGRLVRGDDRIQLDTAGFSCQSEVCVASKPVRIDNNALTIYIPSSESQVEREIKPYADYHANSLVSSVRIVAGDHSNNSPACHFTHDIPVVVFSSGGFAGNLFHEMDEIIIPLFITSRHFRSRVKFVITDYKPWWVSKYSRVLNHLSGYEVINPAADGNVHCFPGGVVGLKFHGFLALNSTDIPVGYSMFDFKHFLRESYNLKINNVSEMEREKPRLMLISRQNSRMFLNEDEMVVMMEELGFEVVRPRPNRMSNLDKFAEVVNSCSVMVGAHGAGLTNELFLPAGAVVVQLVPLGLEWASTYYFSVPASEMGVNYLEYKIEPEESSLVETYGREHPIVTDPASMSAKGYYAFRAVYVDGQNLKVNLGRFRETLVQAMELIGQSN
ncbi:hypothetical protein ACOSP7_030334 [Xanthoceras sorbifolium]|uniref:Glycosyltransferase 61 catalytic domain-containing protein n=1 Tax=Xanthoceras sorbifolium TaxID=99658 RepID=A0ABQ8H2I0_9ROSI|nr:hypothetical protein JRO89_XS15G0164500 [Xanthoceras sorbifolium]